MLTRRIQLSSSKKDVYVQKVTTFNTLVVKGVPMDPKMGFRALARKREVIFRRPSMTLSNLALRFFWWQKNSHRPCRHCAN